MNKKSSPKENHYLSKLEHYISKAKHYFSIPCKTLSFKSKTLMFLKQNIIFQNQKIISQFHTKQPLGKFGAKEGCKIRNKTKCVKNLPRLINPKSPLFSSPLFSTVKVLLADQMNESSHHPSIRPLIGLSVLNHSGVISHRLKQIQVDPSRPKQTQVDPSRPKQTQVEPSRPRQTQADPRRPRQTLKGPSRPTKTRP